MKNNISKILNSAIDYEKKCNASAMLTLPIIGEFVKEWQDNKIGLDLVSTGDYLIGNLNSLDGEATRSNNAKYAEHKKEFNDYSLEVGNLVNTYKFITQNKPDHPDMMNNINNFEKLLYSVSTKGNAISLICNEMKGVGEKFFSILENFGLMAGYQQTLSNIQSAIIRFNNQVTKIVPSVTELKNNVEKIMNQQKSTQVETVAIKDYDDISKIEI